MSPRNSRLDLIEHYMNSRATADDLVKLERALRADLELRTIFLEYANLDSALGAWCAAAPVRFPDRRIVPLRPWWSAGLSAWRPLAAAAAIALVAGGIFWLRLGQPPLRAAVPVAVEILKSEGATLHAAGDRVTLRTLRLEAGSLEFRLDSGARVQAVAPAELDFLSPMELRLRHGKVTADVGRKARGFVIETARARVVDLGTRFGVGVGQSGKTDVAVFEGEVQVFNPNDPGRTTPVIASLTKGEGARFDSRGRPSRLTAISLTRDGLAWSTFSGHSVVTDLTDNVQESGFRYFYGIIPGGMAEGAPAYTDRSRVSWMAANGEVFPPDLVGADLICPFHNDRHDRNLKMTLHLAQPAVVYILHDARKTPLPWLKQDFTNTGWRLRSGPWPNAPVVRDLTANARGEYYIEYTVWRKEVRKAGQIELGPPFVPGRGGVKAMMGIAVKPLGLARLASASGATAPLASRITP